MSSAEHYRLFSYKASPHALPDHSALSMTVARRDVTLYRLTKQVLTLARWCTEIVTHTEIGLQLPGLFHEVVFTWLCHPTHNGTLGADTVLGEVKSVLLRVVFPASGVSFSSTAWLFILCMK